MQQGVNVAVGFGRIHENEGEAAFVKANLVAAGSLAEPAIRINQFLGLHFAGPLACLG